MALHFVTPIVHTQLDAGDLANLVTDIRAALLSADWTESSVTDARIVMTFSGQPVNTQTVTIDGKTYTWKTVLSGAADEIFIGVDAAACASNLRDAINDVSANEGTTYGTGTVAHTTVTASLSGSQVTVTSLTAGVAGNGFTITNSLSNVTLDTTSARYGGYIMRSGKTPHGLEMKLWVRWAGTFGAFPVAELIPMSVDEATVGINGQLQVNAARLLDIHACPYQVLIWLQGTSTTGGCVFECGVPYLDLSERAPTIVSVADDGSGQYLVETSVSHGRVTGESVHIAGAEASGSPLTSLNGTHATVTVTDATHYILDGSTYASGYDANSAVAAGVDQVSRAIWCNAQEHTHARATFRVQLAPSNVSQSYLSMMMNQYAYTHVGAGTIARLATSRSPNDNSNAAPAKKWGGKALFLEPLIGWPITSATSDVFWVGGLWNAAVICDDIDKDSVRNNHSGYNWLAYTDNHDAGTLVLAIAEA